MAKYILGKGAVKTIHDTINHLFDRAKARLFGRKMLTFSAKPIQHREDLSLGGVFDRAAQFHGTVPNQKLKDSLQRVAESYLDVSREKAKAGVVHAVQSYITDIEHSGAEPDVGSMIQDEISSVMNKVRSDVKRIVDTESTKARNFSGLDAVGRIGTASGISDPVVCFMGPNDAHTCDECFRLFFMEDGVTPRCWYRSELKSGYHKHGNDSPSIAGCHPNCRHSIVPVLPGFGFQGGKLEYISHGHDELKTQRGL